MDINLITPINQLGYGITGLNILKALTQRGDRVCFFPIGPGEAPPEDLPIISQSKELAIYYRQYAPSLRIWHAHDMAMHVGKGLHCGFPIFELTKFTDEEKHQLRALDIIFVTSEWAEHIIWDNLPAMYQLRTHVVPLGVDRTFFHENWALENYEETRFFNCGKWEIRKGHDILVSAFNKAFEPDDNVKLLMNCYNPFLTEEQNTAWKLKYTRTKMGKEGKIKVALHRLPCQRELARLMSTVDCGVFPSRAEGWNLEALELMSMGKYVIATNYSAHTEYMNNLNSLLIKVDDTEVACDGIWFHKQGEWAKFGSNQIEQLVDYMRRIHQHKQEKRLGVNSFGIQTAQSFTWANTANKLTQGLLQDG